MYSLAHFAFILDSVEISDVIGYNSLLVVHCSIDKDLDILLLEAKILF